MILADTSVWIDHLRNANPEMQKRLSRDQIVMHPFIAAEIALGSLRNRQARLYELDSLRQVTVAQTGEVRHMIETRSLYAKGIGLIDAHLILSCLLTPGTRLWTRDTALRDSAKAVGVLADLS
ncbi:type II toxin-antitoxin system VapC family toxin [Paracidobacterium acidisoli]|uniref:Ribonuclease VapC n=1 Tax=Paracidobacterium acidisoli TaxID=2303751 RepID=A0A372IND3_9BACT|nr:type II toxin-antitoxin system VapC family toxin [Paracidobacterium acidisoli]